MKNSITTFKFYQIAKLIGECQSLISLTNGFPEDTAQLIYVGRVKQLDSIE